MTATRPWPSAAEIDRLDREDILAGYRQAFVIDPAIIYLDGNSLGPLPRGTAARLDQVVTREWGVDLITSWNAHDWIKAPMRVGDKIARLIGARPGEVLAADSTSVNLFKLAAAALMLAPDRHTILSEKGNFPTDLYVLQGLEALLGGRARLKMASPESLVGAIDEDTALVVLTHSHYASGSVWPMGETTAAAHGKGALMLWDLSHSAGALAVDLNAADADFAIGCGYKYLNGGPGAPGYLFVAERHQRTARSPLCGWMGHDAPFDFADDYVPAAGVGRFLCGTPPILGLTALEAGVDLLEGLDMRLIESKGRALASLFLVLCEARCAGFGLSFAGPQAGHQRGLHLCFRHPDGFAVIQALIERGVVGDFRNPDLLRFGFSPLGLGFADVATAANRLTEVLATRAFDNPQYRLRATVT